MTQRPFEKLLKDAFSTLRVREVTHITFRYQGPSRELETLSRVLGREARQRAVSWFVPA